jgi:DnaJ-class molecular chaperone
VQVVVPTHLDDESEDLMRRFAERNGDDVAPADKGFFKKIKSAFS